MELKDLRGIKEKRLEALESVGIKTSADLLNMLPVKYLDMTTVASSKDLIDGAEVLIKAAVVGEPFNLYYSRVKTTKVKLDTGDKKFFAMWFNQPYMKSNLTSGEKYVFYGKIKNADGKITLLSPMFEREENASRLFGIVAKYQKIDGMPQTLISSAERELIEKERIISVFDEEKFGELPLAEGYKRAHFPLSMQDAESGVSRIFKEKVVRTMLSYRLSGESGVKKTRKYKDIDVKAEMEKLLPFSLTKSQKNAIDEVVSDMKSSASMNRLLQGDVGSGKTVVIMAACLLAAKSGYTCAVMCPTTTLAAQHFKTFSETLTKAGIKVSLVSSGKTKEAFDVADVYVGTHALFSESAEYKNLAFLAIDEQQKFGVSARASLIGKGFSTDVLSLTATPIPRTLSLILYGTLNISYLEKRTEENNVKTRIVGARKLSDMYRYIDALLENGGLAYVVCRKIDTTESSEEEGAEEKFKEIKKAFPSRRVALLHGKMPKAEKEKTIAAFLSDKIDVLVSTSVIEVGVDNPRANAIVVFGAENFGLSSLHQLRGRVGRRGQESWCFLPVGDVTEKQKERLEFFKENSDGFKIADFDLESRGAGDIYGVKQHGKSAYSKNLSGNFSDIKKAKEIADRTEIEELDEEQFKLITQEENDDREKIVLN